MDEWKAQVAYFNPLYHAYAFMYQSEQRPENPPGSSENRVADLSCHDDGAAQTFYAAATSGRIGEVYSEQRYHESGLVYVGGTQTGHLLLTGPHESAGTELRRARSGSTSDVEALASPDSWCSVSNCEGSLPQTDLSIWAKKDDLEGIVRNPEHNRDVSSSIVKEPHALITSKPLPSPAVSCPKAAVRKTFSQSQLEALFKSFSVQTYLRPVDMKDLAKEIGLTYKQVKTWFQNRRMKLRKRQRDASWDSQCYATYYPIDGQPQLREHYHQHSVEAELKRTPRELDYCLGAGSGGFPHWSCTSPQTARCSTTPGGSPCMFNSDNSVHGPSSESKDENPTVSQDSVNAAVVPKVDPVAREQI